MLALANAEKNQTPMPTYVRKIANAKSAQAKSVFLLLLCLESMVVRSNSMTAKAQGLMLSDNAAGSMIPKNHSLFHRLRLLLR